MHPRIAAVAVLACAVSCRYSNPVERFSDVERKAAEYGFISAGAIRVAPFQLTAWKELRDKQLQAIDELAKEFKTPPKPEWSSAYLSVQDLLLNLSLFYKGVPAIGDGDKPPAANSELYSKLQSTLNDLFSKALDSVATEANRIDMARLRLGYLKYLDNQYENLRLLETLPLDRTKYRRVIVSVQLTALVRREAAAGAVVFLDLYPLRGDTWAHFAGRALEQELKKSQGADRTDEDVNAAFKAGWLKHLTMLERSFFDTKAFGEYKVNDRDRLDPIGAMHHYLAANGLLPKIVHVDPLDEGELFDQLTLTASSTRTGLSLGATLPNVSALASGAVGSTGAQGERSQQINPLSVAFAAGDSRAGWLFFPSQGNSNSAISKPTERRFRMIVDIPKSLKLVAMHVHKMFTDRELQPIASFREQLADLNLARQLLSQSEGDYPDVPTIRELNDPVGPIDFRSPAYWELMKSRMRNILYQGWSENLSFELMEEPKALPIPPQTAIVEDDGEKASTVVLHGKGGLSAGDFRATLQDGAAELQATAVEADPARDQVKLTFPSMLKVKGSVGALKVKIEYDPIVIKDLKAAEFPTFHVVLKKAEKAPGFAMKVQTKQILVRKDGTGELGVLLKLDKEPAKKVTFDVSGADLISPAEFAAPKDGRVVLQFANLSTSSPVTITARNQEETAVPGVTVNVQAMPAEKEKEK